jgi:hypothetical protein
MSKLIARPSTIAAAIKVTQEKINKGFSKGNRFYDMSIGAQSSIYGALSEMRDDEHRILAVLMELKK